MRTNDMRLDIVLDEIAEVHNALEGICNLLSLADQMQAALHGEPHHKSPLTLKAEAAREIVSEWMKRAHEQHQRDIG